MSKPDDWVFYVKQLATASTDGESSIRAAMKELDKAGYIERKQTKGEDGKFNSYETIVYETAALRFSAYGFSASGKSSTTNIDSTKNKDTTCSDDTSNSSKPLNSIERKDADFLKSENASECTRIDSDPDPTSGMGSGDEKPARARYDASLPQNGGLAWKDVLSTFMNAWNQKAGGQLVHAHVVKPLRTLVEWHGAVKVLDNWKRYIEDTEPKYLSFKTFREKFGSYDAPAPVATSNVIKGVEDLL